MAHTKENKNRVITVERLDQFYNGIRNTFLTKDDADNYYAGIHGNAENDFNAYQLNATRFYLDDGVMFKFITPAKGGPGLEIQGSDGGEETGKVLVPLNSGIKEMATLDDIDGKVSSIAVTIHNGTSTNAFAFSELPHPQVFTGILGETSGSVAFRQLYYVKSGTTYGSLGTITRAGFYAVTGVAVVSGVSTISAIQFVCPPSRYVLYYNISEETICRYDSATSAGSNSPFIPISTGSGTTPIDPPSDYETASSEDITGIIESYINNA